MSLYLGFALTSLILAFTPGPDLLMVISLSAREGLKPALLFISGLVTGVWFHVLLLLLGISALISTIPGAMRFMAVFGIAYLLYLAFLTFKERHAPVINNDESGPAPATERSRFWRGTIMNISNPKVLMFFLAFFPQFAQINEPGYQLRIVLLAIIFIVCSFVAFAMVAWLTAKLGQKQMTNPRYKIIMDWFSILVFVVLAILMLLTLVF